MVTSMASAAATVVSFLVIFPSLGLIDANLHKVL
jgi:hypothetical protein